jgi:diguanylate cyclase
MSPLVAAAISTLQHDLRSLKNDLESLRKRNEELESLQQRNKELEQRLEEVIQLSLEDPLTKILNFRGFERALETAFRREFREAYPEKPETASEKGVVLLMMDLNKFKPINDTYGHEAGNAALQHFSRTIHQMIRAEDTVARLGGDEFAVILTDTTTEQSAPHIEAIRKQISSLEFDWMDEKGEHHAIQFGGTVIAYDCDLGKTPAENYKLADWELIEAKKAGRKSPNNHSGPNPQIR